MTISLDTCARASNTDPRGKKSYHDEEQQKEKTRTNIRAFSFRRDSE